jgi:hypothetical protein
MCLKSGIVLLLVFKLALSNSSSNIFIKSDVPKQNANTTKAKTDNLLLLEKIVESKLKLIKNDELNIPIVQEIVDSWTFSEDIDTDVDMVQKIANSIQVKIQPAIKILKDICSFLTNKEHRRQIFYSLINPCPHNDKIDVRINHFYNEIYHNNFSGEINIDILNDRNLIFHNYLIENIGNVEQAWQSYRQYFLSTSDHGKIENCNNVHDISHFSAVYANAITNKRVLILLDQTSEQMDIVKSVAKAIVSTLSESDQISVILIGDKATAFSSRSDSCSKETAMSPVSSRIKMKIYDFLDNANRTNGIANHTLGFKTAFEVFDKLYKESNSISMLPITFLYISEGVTALFADARNVLAEITLGQSRLIHPVVINTCAIIANSRQIPYQTQFLQDITAQNFTKYSIEVGNWMYRKGERSLIGKMLIINRTMENVNKISTTIVTELFKYKRFINNQLTLHPPFFDDEYSNDFVVSLSKACDQRGVFGIDLFLNYLIEDVLYSDQYNYSYKFLVDLKTGNALAHSVFYPRPITLKQSFNLVHIKTLEKDKGFDDGVWFKMKNQTKGSIKLDSYLYTWNQVSDLMIVCIVTKLSDRKPNVLNRIKSPFDQSKHLSELLYHRIDLLSSHNSIGTCQYYKQIATFDAITLHLSSKSFISPYAHMNNIESDDTSVHTIQNFMAYLRDTRNLFANPGLIEGIRQEVSGIYQIMEFLKKKHLDLDMRKNGKYIIRRYASSMNGVLQVFPGCMLDGDFEASRRPWFVKAMEAKGRIAVTEPYLDAAGAGYIVSVSYAVYEKRYGSNQNRTYQPVAVISVDFTRGFFYKILLDSIAICADNGIKCFLMDDKGYLIAHKNILETKGEHFRQPEHITHKESHVANDILMQRKIVEKIACNNFINGTSQRFYQFNTSITEVITNYANVEKTKYQLTSLKGTNLFVGIINSSSETSGAFCPCSTIDFRCLNCFRMEQNECECPCECRIDNDEGCGVENKAYNTSLNPMCPQQIEYIFSYTQPVVKDNIESCNLFNCDMFAEKEDCLGVIGCIW